LGEKIKVAGKVPLSPKNMFLFDFIDLYRLPKNSGKLILFSSALNMWEKTRQELCQLTTG
jgi:hypothetical protein